MVSRMKKSIIKKIILFLFITTISFIYYYFLTKINGDEIWNYGFSYNISLGAVPYKDFNMIILPLYQLFISIFIKIFGNHLMVYHIINSILCGIVLTILYKKINKNVFFLFLYFLIINFAYGYNFFILLLFLLILYLEETNFKYNDYIIAFLIGCICMIKCNIGCLLLIPFIISHKNNIKSIIFMFVPIIFVLIYLIYNHAFYQCIDYCFLGIGNFIDNFLCYPQVLLIELLIISFLIYRFIKSRDVIIIYILCFQVMCFPLIEPYHFSISFIPVVYYILTNDCSKYIKLIVKLVSIIFLTLNILLFIYDYGIYLSNIDHIKFRAVSYNFDNRINDDLNYIFFNSDKRIFNFSSTAYLYKIITNQRIDKFDLINKGNMGSDENKYNLDIENICNNQKCLFIVDELSFSSKYSQFNDAIYNFIIDNYDMCDSLYNYKIYCNYKVEY